MTIILFYFTTPTQLYGNFLPKNALRLNLLYALRCYLTAHAVMGHKLLHLAEKVYLWKSFLRNSRQNVAVISSFRMNIRRTSFVLFFHERSFVLNFFNEMPRSPQLSGTILVLLGPPL